MTTEQESVNPQMLQHMAAINRLNLKAYDADTMQALIFTILNDTIHAIRYDRAVLVDPTTKTPRVLGVSGQSEANKDAHLTKQWQSIVKGLKDSKSPQLINEESFDGDTTVWNEYKEKTKASMIWLPILHDDKLVLGLILEVFGNIRDEQKIKETLTFLSSYLTPAYGSAWSRHAPKYKLKHKGLGKKQIFVAAAALFLFLLIVRVPLRIVAPCEIVADNPVMITAPLEGIIAEVTVDPGQEVKQAETLVEYDKRVPMRNLNVAQKEVEILEAEIKRARTLGLTDAKSRTELGLLELKLKKEQINLELAKWQSSQLTIKAPESGVVMLDDPDAWRGKPVRVGERIMTINNPKDTKIRIWIPESDNVVLNQNEPIKIFLNIDPQVSHRATLIYVANESIINEAQLPSFLAEAQWVNQPEDIKLGLKGSAILYGEKVTLLYYVGRKPWATFRSFVGF